MVVHCLYCQQPKTIADDRLKPHIGKQVKVPCNHCGQPFAFVVPSDFSHTASPADEAGTQLFNTQKTRGRAMIQVAENKFQAYQDFELVLPSMTIGRLSSESQSIRPDINIITQDMHMSKLHCQIERSERNGRIRFILSDYNSTNQTYLNQQLLEADEQVVLQDGDHIRIGNAQITFRLL